MNTNENDSHCQLKVGKSLYTKADIAWWLSYKKQTVGLNS